MPRWNFDFSGNAPEYDFRPPQFSFGQSYPTSFRMGTNQPINFAQALGQRQEPQETPEDRAYRNLIDVQNQMPVYGDKKYERGKLGKLGAILAGAATAGFTDPATGYQLATSIMDEPYDRAMKQWGQRFKVAKDTAIEERNRIKESREGRKTEAEITNLESQANERDALLGLKGADLEAGIRARLASAGHDEASTQKILDEIKNPNLIPKEDNRGGLTFYNSKTGDQVKRYENVGLSDATLIKLRGDQAVREEGVRAGNEMGRLRFSLDKQHENALDLASQKNKYDIGLAAMNQYGQNMRLDKRLEAAKDGKEATGKLTDPQFQQAFAGEIAKLEASRPDLVPILREKFSHKPNGMIFLADPEDAETINYFNQILLRIRGAGQ